MGTAPTYRGATIGYVSGDLLASYIINFEIKVISKVVFPLAKIKLCDCSVSKSFGNWESCKVATK